MRDDPWAALAPLYDWEHGAFVDDVAAYLALARRTGGPVLEGACGTGRVVLPLARQGFAVVGFDRSAAMLALARARVAAAGLPGDRVRLFEGDLRSAEAGGPFGLAILALDALGLLLEQSDQLAALRNLGGQLRRGGLLAIDVANGNARGGEPTEELRHHFTRPHPEHGRPVTKWVARHTDPAEQVDELCYLYDEVGLDGRVTRTVAWHRLRYFHRFELTWLVERVGLRIEGVYGDYDFSPFAAESPRLFVVARRPDDTPLATDPGLGRSVAPTG